MSLSKRPTRWSQASLEGLAKLARSCGDVGDINTRLQDAIQLRVKRICGKSGLLKGARKRAKTKSSAGGGIGGGGIAVREEGLGKKDAGGGAVREARNSGKPATASTITSGQGTASESGGEDKLNTKERRPTPRRRSRGSPSTNRYRPKSNGLRHAK